MKLILSCVLVAVIAATASAQTEQTGWEEFAPEGAGFSVLVPTKPVETITTKTNYTMHSFTTTAGRATYVASYTDYQQIKLGPAAFLNANRDRFNKALQATLMRLEPVWRTELVRLLPELLAQQPELPPPEPLTERWQRQRLFEALARRF